MTKILPKTPHTRPNTPARPEAPTEALSRPQELKNWSADLLGILERQKSAVLNDWDFRQDRLTRADWTRITKKMTGCGSVVELRAKIDRGTGEIGSPALHAANFCGQHTICPYCAARVQDRRKARFREPIFAAVREYKYAYLVTATIPPVPTWREDLNMLLDSWKSFRKMGQKRTGRKSARSSGEWSKIRAGISKVELKRGAGSGLPHCHIHALFFTDEYLDFRVWTPEEKAKPKGERESLFANNGSKISREWQQATDGRATGINCKLLKWRPPKKRPGESGRSLKNRTEDWSLADSIYEQSREVLKYATKFDSSPKTGAEKLFAQDFFAIKSATYGRRLFQTFGAFRNVGGSDLTGSSLPLSESPIIYEARWRSDRYSPLRERSRPVFQNSDPGPALSERLKILNRVQGCTRRLRRAIDDSKRLFLETQNLGPALFTRREFLDDGGFRDIPCPIEIPAFLAADPHNLGNWERWVNEASEAGRIAYSSARADLDGESHIRQIGTIEERQAQETIERRAFRQADGYNAYVNRIFISTLDPSSGPP